MPALNGASGVSKAGALPFHQRAPVIDAPPRCSMPGWLSLLCGVVVLIAAAYLLYAVLRPESF
jgi:type VI protein secretion system component VasF